MSENRGNTPSITAKYWLKVLGFIFLAGFLVFIHIRLYQYAFDDAYIHFRIARNFIETGKPYYNLGEAVKVSSSSGWTIFLTILYAIARLFTVDNAIPLIVGIINALITITGMFVYTAILEAVLYKKLAILNRSLFQICFLALLLPSSIGLMETPFAILVAGVGILLLLKSKLYGFAFLGLAAYLRIELLVLLGLACLFTFLQNKSRLWSILGYSAAGFLPILFYDLYFFHTPIPQSVVAKSIVYTAEGSPSVISTILRIVLILGLGITLLGIGVINRSPKYKQWKGFKSYWPLLFWLWGLLMIGGYIFGQAFIFEWYIPLFSVPCLVAGLLWLFSIENPRSLVLKSLVGIIFIIASVSILIDFTASVRNPSLFSLFESGSRVKSYLRIGSLLHQEYPSAKLLTSEIGGLGYSFKGEILDAAGLASLQALAFHPMKIPEERPNGQIGAIPPGYVNQTMPELIVSYDIFAGALLSSEVIGQYNVIKLPAFLPEDAAFTKSETLWGSQYLRVYIRNDLPISEKLLAIGK